MASAVIDLPQPVAQASQRLAGGDREADAVDDECADAHRETKWRALRPSAEVRSSLLPRVRGSMMSRMASAMTLTASTSVKRAMEAPARFHQMIGVRDSSLRAWSIICPSLPSSPMPR